MKRKKSSYRKRHRHRQEGAEPELEQARLHIEPVAQYRFVLLEELEQETPQSAGSGHCKTMSTVKKCKELK